MLGAITGKLAALQEQARNFKVPEELRHNISANLANARDFIGLSQPGTPEGAAAGGPSTSDAFERRPGGGTGGAAQAEELPLSRCTPGATLWPATVPCRNIPRGLCPQFVALLQFRALPGPAVAGAAWGL